MTNINLLNDITQKTQGPKRSKSLFKRLFMGGGKPKSAPPNPQSKKPSSNKPQPKAKQTSVLTPLLLFILPLTGCFYLETLLQEIMNDSVSQLSQRLEKEAQQFNDIYQAPPDVTMWENRYEVLQQAAGALAQVQPLDIQMSIEYLRQMTTSLPKEAWIKQVVVGYNINNGTHQVDIEGYAFTSETVLLFLAQLKTQPLFEHVELKFSRPTTENGIQEHRFHVIAKSSHNNINALDVFHRSWLYNKLYPLVWRMP